MGRPRGPSELSASPRDCWLKPWALRPEPVLPGTAGQPRVPSAQARVPWDNCSAPRHLARSRVARDVGRNRGPLGTGLSCLKAWSTMRTLLLGPESPRKVVDSTGIRTLVQVTGTVGQHHGRSDPGPRHPGELFDPECIWTWPQWPGTAGRPRGPLDASACGPGEQVDPAGPRSRAGVLWDSFMTL